MKLSVDLGHGLLSSVLVDGNVSEYTVKRYDEDSEISVLEGLKIGLNMVKNYIDHNTTTPDGVLLIETKAKTMQQWVDRGFATDKHNRLFVEVVKMIEDLPIRYRFTSSEKPVAHYYLKEQYIKKPKVVKFDFDAIEDN